MAWLPGLSIYVVLSFQRYKSTNFRNKIKSSWQYLNLNFPFVAIKKKYNPRNKKNLFSLLESNLDKGNFSYSQQCFWCVLCNQGLYYSQAGDEAVMELLLKSNIDVNDIDAEGNTALHFTLKASMGSCQHVQQNRSLSVSSLLVSLGPKLLLL